MFKKLKLWAHTHTHTQCIAIQYLCIFPINKLYSLPRLIMVLTGALLHLLRLHSTHMFDSRPVHVGFVVKKLAEILDFLIVLQFHPVIISPSIDHTHSHLLVTLIQRGGTQWCSWLKHCATSQNVIGLILNGIIDLKLSATRWVWSQLSLWQKEYQKYFL
jgi:hypothetical protein